ncbi:MAG: ribonuclease III [Oscillospiraceae bacterium]|jgi:ribonuclease-3|nr:ribonuclease III [Oscillospiraceae bacterium]
MDDMENVPSANVSPADVSSADVFTAGASSADVSPADVSSADVSPAGASSIDVFPIKLEEALRYSFQDESLIETALTHPSALKPDGAQDNQRLEFLGDAVLELCASRALYDRYPEAREGELTRMRIALVREETLCDAARRLGLGEYINMACGDRIAGAHKRPSVLADTFEAVLAAVYLDGGLEAAYELAQRSLADFNPDVPLSSSINWKSLLQELVQGRGEPTPSYRVIKQTGPAHAPQFTVAAICGEKILAQGIGGSKKEAEQNAAQAALSREEISGSQRGADEEALEGV